MTALLLLQLLCWIALAEGQFMEDQNMGDRIVGGFEVMKNSVKYMASIQGPNGHYCGGTLVHPQWVLSAAHCFYPINKLTVQLGKHNLSKQEVTTQTFTVIKVALHPQYNQRTLNFDAMLLKLHTKASLTTAVQVAALPTQGSSLTEPITCFAYGWGIQNVYSFTLSDVLQGVEIPFVPHATCNSQYRGTITVNMICAGKMGRDSCKGDSGGPLICTGKLEGIVSWGYSCATQLPGIYARVATIRTWINNIIASI